MSTEKEQKEYEELLTKNKRTKKTILKIFVGCVGVLIVLAIILVAVDHFTKKETVAPELPPLDIAFYEPYEGDIFSYEPYLALDRKTYYNDGRVILSIEEERIGDFDEYVLFVRNFIEIMKRGDSEAYNACFVDSPKQAAFSQQMIYEAEIILEGWENAENSTRLVTYRLEYKIHRNDGTLRRDVGSDAIIPQFIVLRVSPDGDISIDRLYGMRIVTETESEPS